MGRIMLLEEKYGMLLETIAHINMNTTDRRNSTMDEARITSMKDDILQGIYDTNGDITQSSPVKGIDRSGYLGTNLVNNQDNAAKEAEKERVKQLEDEFYKLNEEIKKASNEVDKYNVDYEVFKRVNFSDYYRNMEHGANKRPET